MSGLFINAPLDGVLKRYDGVVIGALALTTLTAAVYTVLGIGMGMSAWEMTAMPTDMPMPTRAWTPLYALMLFLMWWIMMIAMMLPSAAPMILLYARVGRRKRIALGDPASGFFCLGYLVVWGVFSLGATMIHGIGEHVALINGMMVVSGAWMSALIFIAAGIWQFLPIKARCLEACRQPIEFLSKIWAPGRIGAFQMGLRHGLFCVGCCWAMMLLLFVGGVMNLYWIAGLAGLALIEKLCAKWRLVPYAIGCGFLLMGGLMLV